MSERFTHPPTHPLPNHQKAYYNPAMGCEVVPVAYLDLTLKISSVTLVIVESKSGYGNHPNGDTSVGKYGQ